MEEKKLKKTLIILSYILKLTIENWESYIRSKVDLKNMVYHNLFNLPWNTF